ncbi:NAD(P)/FAD-dependent oxidoreductase [Pseudactinotalea sp. Z1739]|uniref:NAD(P)/FAD-dependent oxidoreductase n=1 Tax=Pseudactinotalea sp. Z1739 TaxID=3413028 RepID=UPI003C7B85B2
MGSLRNRRIAAVRQRSIPTPKSAIVVGAGMVGLATAWHLRRAGLDVTVVEQDHVAAGASWGNAGWLTPPITTPLPEPAILRSGLKAFISPNSPVYVPPRIDPVLIRFLAGFLRRSTAGAWTRAMGHYIPLNRESLAAFDELTENGVSEPTVEPEAFLACFARPGQHKLLMEEFDQIRAAGQDVGADLLDGDAAREIVPALSEQVVEAIRLHGTRFMDPPAFLTSLAAAVRAQGTTVHEGRRVIAADGGGPGSPASVTVADNVRSGQTRSESPARTGGEVERLDADVVVLATGAWLPQLSRGFGVRQVVQAGRGYSFTVSVDPAPTVPVYFPAQRVACTPLGGRLRVAGMMEFQRPDAPLDPRRIKAIVGATRPLLTGADFEAREDEWVGSRPVTPDGLPQIGPTASPRVHIAGGHGMWGITLGPLTGRLLTEAITTGQVPELLAPFDPLR